MTSTNKVPAGTSATHRPALVLSCAGAPEGDLNVVRSLGQAGVPVIVLSEYAAPPSARSRWCDAFVHLDRFTSGDPQRLLQLLRRLRQELGVAPVVFPTADPDLQALLALEGQLDDVVVTTLPPAELTRTLIDKARCESLAEAVGLPMPRSRRAGGAAPTGDLAYPLMAKPSSPKAWQMTGTPAQLRSAKAVQLDDAAALASLAEQLPAPAWVDTLLQEYVPGADEQHYGFHAVVDPEGRVLATSVTRNWRVYPPFAGGGCCMESVDVPQLQEQALSALRAVGFRRGIANMDYKRHAKTGEFKLLEINPRISQAHAVSTQAGVNLPWLMWRSVCGFPPLPQPKRRIGVRYVNEWDDLHAWRIYRRHGLWPLGDYLRTVLGGQVTRQWLYGHDLGPVTDALRRRWAARSVAASVPVDAGERTSLLTEAQIQRLRRPASAA